jgi:hypothetical protein
VDLVPVARIKTGDAVRAYEKLKLGIVSISPNPVNSVGTLTLQSNMPAEVEIKIVDISGRTVAGFIHEVLKGLNTIELDVGELPAGGYSLRVVSGGATAATYKFIKI